MFKVACHSVLNAIGRTVSKGLRTTRVLQSPTVTFPREGRLIQPLHERAVNNAKLPLFGSSFSTVSSQRTVQKPLINSNDIWTSRSPNQRPDNSHCGTGLILRRDGNPVPQDEIKALMDVLALRGAIGLDGSSDGWSLAMVPDQDTVSRYFPEAVDAFEQGRLVFSSHYLGENAMQSEAFFKFVIQEANCELLGEWKRDGSDPSNPLCHWAIALPKCLDATQISREMRARLVMMDIPLDETLSKEDQFKLSQWVRYKMSLSPQNVDSVLYAIGNEIVTAGLTPEERIFDDFRELSRVSGPRFRVHYRASTRTEATLKGAHGTVMENGENTQDQSRFIKELLLDQKLGLPDVNLSDMPDTHVGELLIFALITEGRTFEEAYATVRPLFHNQEESLYSKVVRLLWGSTHQGPFLSQTPTPDGHSIIIHTDGRRPNEVVQSDDHLEVASNRVTRGDSLRLAKKEALLFSQSGTAAFPLDKLNEKAEAFLALLPSYPNGISQLSPEFTDFDRRSVRRAALVETDRKEYYETVKKGKEATKAMGRKNDQAQNPWSQEYLGKHPFVRGTAPCLQAAHRSTDALQFILGPKPSIREGLDSDCLEKRSLLCHSPLLLPEEFDHVSEGAPVISCVLDSMTHPQALIDETMRVVQNVLSEIRKGESIIILKNYSEQKTEMPMDMTYLLFKLRSELPDPSLLANCSLILDSKHVMSSTESAAFFNLGLKAVYNRAFYNTSLGESTEERQGIREAWNKELVSLMGGAGISQFAGFQNRGDISAQHFTESLLIDLGVEAIPYSGVLEVSYPLILERLVRRYVHKGEDAVRGYLKQPYGPKIRSQLAFDPRTPQMIADLQLALDDKDPDRVLEALERSRIKVFTALGDIALNAIVQRSQINIFGAGVAGLESFAQIIENVSPEVLKHTRICIFSAGPPLGLAYEAMLHEDRAKGVSKRYLAAIEKADSLGVDLQVYGGKYLTEEEVRSIQKMGSINIGAMGSGSSRQSDIPGKEYLTPIEDFLAQQERAASTLSERNRHNG